MWLMLTEDGNEYFEGGEMVDMITARRKWKKKISISVGNTCRILFELGWNYASRHARDSQHLIVVLNRQLSWSNIADLNAMVERPSLVSTKADWFFRIVYKAHLAPRHSLLLILSNTPSSPPMHQHTSEL